MCYFKKIISLQLFLSLLFTPSIYCFDLQKNMIVVGLMGAAGFVGYQVAKNVTEKRYAKELQDRQNRHSESLKKNSENNTKLLENLKLQHVKHIDKMVKNEWIREKFLIHLIAHNSLVVHRCFPNFKSENCNISNNQQDKIYTIALGSHNLYFPYFPGLLTQDRKYYVNWIKKLKQEVQVLKKERQ